MRIIRLVAIASLAAFTTLHAQGVPSQLRTSEDQARQSLVDTLPGNGVPFGLAAGKAFVALPAAARAAVVGASVLWMKTYVNSAAFRTAYAQAREKAKPLAPDAPGSVDQAVKREQDEQAKGFAEARSALALMPADQRSAMEAQIRQAEAQLKSPEMVKMLRAEVEETLKNQKDSYDDEVRKWQEAYPANPLVLVSRRLQQFMTVSADVDFNAKLVSVDGKMKFENPAYEEKSQEWKMCFRAGREAVAAARPAAAAWLKELPAR